MKKKSISRTQDDLNILLIEDRTEDADLTRAAFAEAGLGWNFRWVQDGIQATNHVRSISTGKIPVPDLILLDLNLPRKDGRKLLSEFRQDPLLQDTPVIVMTGSRSEEDIEACHRHGASSFVFKPINWDQYRAMVKFIEEFWRSHSSIPPVWVNTLGSRARSDKSSDASLMSATQHLLKASAAANDAEGFGWKQMLLIVLNLKWAWEALTSFGEEEIRSETGILKAVEKDSPWFGPRLDHLEQQLIELEGKVADLTYEMEGFAGTKGKVSPAWLRDRLERLIAGLKEVISEENKIIVDQFVDLGMPG